MFRLNKYLIKDDFRKARQHAILSDTFELPWEMMT